MPVRVQLPDLEHWKAQVKCQAGCPVRTDAGRYVQLIEIGKLRADGHVAPRGGRSSVSCCPRRGYDDRHE